MRNRELWYLGLVRDLYIRGLDPPQTVFVNIKSAAMSLEQHEGIWKTVPLPCGEQRPDVRRGDHLRKSPVSSCQVVHGRVVDNVTKVLT